MKLIGKKKLVKAVLNKNIQVFIVYIAFLIFKITIHLAWKAQITLLSIEKILEYILAKYANYINIFSKKLAAKLSKCFYITKHVINLELDK